MGKTGRFLGILFAILTGVSCSNTSPGVGDVSGQAPLSRTAPAELPEPAGVSPQLWDLLNSELRRVIAQTAANRSTAATLADPANKVTDLSLEPAGTDELTLTWTFRNKGDYNHDGEVNVSDLTPIGQNWDARVGDPDWATARCADGDGDLRITVSDITPIGQSWLNSISGYYLQISATPNSESSWTDIEHVTTGSGVKPVGGGMRRFSLTCPAVDGRCYRVVPLGKSMRGLPSNHVQYLSPVPRQVMGVSASLGTLMRRVQVTWSAVAGDADYILERAEAVDGEYTELARIENGDIEYTDYSTEVETSYWYRVSALRNALQGEPSEPAEGWCRPRNWTGFFDNGGRDVGNCIDLDAAGNVYMGGYNSVEECHHWHGTVLKYTPEGEPLWAHRMKGDDDHILYDILVHPDGYLFVCGPTTDHAGTSYIGWLGRGDLDGNFDKHLLLDNTEYSFFDGLALAADGNIIAVGTSGEGFAKDIILVKFDIHFNVIWYRYWSGDKDHTAQSVVVAPDDTIYLTGYTYDDNSTTHGLLLRFSTDGDLLAQKTFSRGGLRWRDLAVDNAGNVTLVGDNPF